MFEIPWLSLIGGMLIGISAISLMLLFGKTAGISGIMNGIVDKSQADKSWRIIFLLSLALGGGLVVVLQAGHMPEQYSASLPLLIIAGLLVGFGTRLANGCTSGHGICGLGRFSARSLAATCVFMATAMLTVWVMK